MSNFKGSRQVDHGKRQQQQLTGSHARAPNTFPSHLDLLSPRSMGVFNNAEPPDSPPDAMDLVRPNFSEFENRNSGLGVGISPMPKSNLRLVRPQQVPTNNLARKSVPNSQHFPANSDRPIPQQSPVTNFDRRIVLEKRPTTSSTTLVPRNSGSNFSVQESSSGNSSQPSETSSSSSSSTTTTRMTTPKNTSVENKLSPQELERIRINRASELYRLQREKFNEMNQQTARRSDASEELATTMSTPSPPPNGIGMIQSRQGGAKQGYQGASRVPSVSSPQPVTSEAKLSTTATLRASRIVKFRQQNNQNSELGGLTRGDQNTSMLSTQKRGKELE